MEVFKAGLGTVFNEKAVDGMVGAIMASSRVAELVEQLEAQQGEPAAAAAAHADVLMCLLGSARGSKKRSLSACKCTCSHMLQSGRG